MGPYACTNVVLIMKWNKMDYDFFVTFPHKMECVFVQYCCIGPILYNCCKEGIGYVVYKCIS